jgi:uncharacterized protein YhaN
MKQLQFKELQLNNFGRFHNKTIILKDGLNLIYGENEAGKSTVHFFIQGMLFGIEKLRGRASKEDAYAKYQPWDNPGAYNGSLVLENGEKNYRIIRNFDKNNKSFSITDLETGREINLSKEDLTEFYGGLTESGYRNTISIAQLKARTDQELSEEVRNYITNLTMSGSNEVDVSKALSFLQERKKALEDEQIGRKIINLEKEIEEGLDKEAKADSFSNSYKNLEEKEKLLLQKKELSDKNIVPEGFTSIEEYQEYLDQYPVIREKYSSFLDLKEQLLVIKNRQNNIEKAMQETGVSGAAIRKQLDELSALSNKLNLTKDKKANLLIEKEKDLEQAKKRNKLYCFIPMLLSVLIFIIFLGSNPLITSISSGVLVAAAGVYAYLNKKLNIRGQEYEVRDEEFDKEINDNLVKRKNILQQFNTVYEQDIREKYEDALRCEAAIENKNSQKKEYELQANQLKSKILNLEQDLYNYYNRSANRMEETENSRDGRKDFIEKKASNSYESDTEMNDLKMDCLKIFVKEEKQKLNEQKEFAAKEYENCLLQKEKLRWELVALEGYEEKLMEDQDLHKDLLQKQKEIETEISAIKLAIDTIGGLSIDIHDSFGKDLNQLVSILIKEMTQGFYTDVKIDEKLNIKVGHKDIFVPLDKLSAGTMEQLFFALRISISDLLHGDVLMPILLDDCFAYYDEKRTTAALEYLTKKRKSQVIIFTCHKREKEILDSLGANYHYIDLSYNTV